MNISVFFENTRENTTIRSRLYLLLLIGCMCVAGCGYATADTNESADTTLTVRDQITANDSISDESWIMPGIGHQDDLLMDPYPHIRSHERESAHNATDVKNATSVSSAVSTRAAGSETGSSGVNTTDLELTWQRCVGGSEDEESYAMIQTSDGGYLMGGYSYSNDGDVSGNHGSADYWIAKFDASKNLQWQKCLGGTGFEVISSIIQTTDGGYLAGGHSFSNDGNVTGNHGKSDIWIVKLDASGNITWQKCFGGSEYELIYSVIQMSDGGYLIGGATDSDDGDVSGHHGSRDIWVVKLDTSGNLVWQKCLGGSLHDVSYTTIQTTDGGFLVYGKTYSDDGNVTGYHGGLDIWVVKLDSAGTLVWQNCLGGSGLDYPYSVIQTTDGGYLVNGCSTSNDGNVTGNHGNSDIWALKLDTSGNLVWQKYLG
ncbi:MAG: hypothetical protein LUQ50_09895, partial [Methanospirillum sp.]